MPPNFSGFEQQPRMEPRVLWSTGQDHLLHLSRAQMGDKGD